MSDASFPFNPMAFDRRDCSDDAIKALYTQLMLPRMIEEKMMSQLRQGKISKWFSGMGQEAISVGVAAAMPKDKFIFPMHRNLGIFTTRKVPLDRLFAQFQGKMPPEALDALQESFGLSNDPLPLQFLAYLQSLFQGDFGISLLYYPSPVSEVMTQALGWTVLLATLWVKLS